MNNKPLTKREESIAKKIVYAANAIHKILGPGLFQKVYNLGVLVSLWLNYYLNCCMENKRGKSNISLILTVFSNLRPGRKGGIWDFRLRNITFGIADFRFQILDWGISRLGLGNWHKGGKKFYLDKWDALSQKKYSLDDVDI